MEAPRRAACAGVGLNFSIHSPAFRVARSGAGAVRRFDMSAAQNADAVPVAYGRYELWYSMASPYTTMDDRTPLLCSWLQVRHGRWSSARFVVNVRDAAGSGSASQAVSAEAIVPVILSPSSVTDQTRFRLIWKSLDAAWRRRIRARERWRDAQLRWPRH